MLVGSLLIVDLRVIGVASHLPLIRVDRFIKLTLIGFAINVLTGIGFFIGDPDRYFPNIAFRLKMMLIVIAGLNAAYYTWRVRPKIKAGLEGADLPFEARYIASLSLTLWTLVIVLGRLIPYVEA